MLDEITKFVYDMYNSMFDYYCPVCGMPVEYGYTEYCPYCHERLVYWAGDIYTDNELNEGVYYATGN